MNVYMPASGIVEERRRFLDWRFLAALAALILIAFLVWAGFRNYAIREAEAEQKDALISQLAERTAEIDGLQAQVERMHEQARNDRKAWQDERRDARRERAKLLRQQETMLRMLRRYGAPRIIVQRARESKEPVSSARTAPTSSPTTRPTPTSQPVVKGAAQSRPKPASTAGKSGKTPPGEAKGLDR